jgi:hypothetical protein
VSEERKRWRAAGEPSPFTMNRERLCRSDVWEALDWIEAQLVESDMIFDSAVRKKFTNLRSMLATMLPPDRPRLDCPYADCSFFFDSTMALAEHMDWGHRNEPRPLAAVP